MLSAVFPIVFIILALPVGYYVDKRGFRKAVLLGSAFFAVFGVLRVFVATFLLLLVFQTLAAVGQPFKDTPVKIIVEIVLTLSKYQHVIRCQFGKNIVSPVNVFCSSISLKNDFFSPLLISLKNRHEIRS